MTICVFSFTSVCEIFLITFEGIEYHKVSKFLVFCATDCETTVLVAPRHFNNVILTTYDKSTCKWYIKTKQTVIGRFIYQSDRLFLCKWVVIHYNKLQCGAQCRLLHSVVLLKKRVIQNFYYKTSYCTT